MVVVVKSWEERGFTFVLSRTYTQETPNEVYGIWKVADGHQAGTTVKDPRSGQHFISCNYTPAQLAGDYAKQGMVNASREAYSSLQEELVGELYGDMIHVLLEVFAEEVMLASDGICTPVYEEHSLDDAAEEMLDEHFDIPGLVEEAKEKARDIAAKLATVGA
jgi:hypothetical protein